MLFRLSRSLSVSETPSRARTDFAGRLHPDYLSVQVLERRLVLSYSTSTYSARPTTNSCFVVIRVPLAPTASAPHNHGGSPAAHFAQREHDDH